MHVTVHVCTSAGPDLVGFDRLCCCRWRWSKRPTCRVRSRWKSQRRVKTARRSILQHRATLAITSTSWHIKYKIETVSKRLLAHSNSQGHAWYRHVLMCLFLSYLTASTSQQGTAGHVEAGGDVRGGGRGPGILRQAHSSDRGQMSSSCPGKHPHFVMSYYVDIWLVSRFFHTLSDSLSQDMCLNTFMLCSWSMWWCAFLHTWVLLGYLE